MHTIVERSLLVQEQVELPTGFKMATETFCEGWSFTRSSDALRLKKKIERHGWSLVGNSVGCERSGVGTTSQQAIAGALTLALRRLAVRFNAVEIEQIQLTQYPWFFLARVIVNPYRIQESTALTLCGDTDSLPVRVRQAVQSAQKAALHPLFASAMPQLKESLIVS